ncbi:hypothetical protein K9M06_01850 [Candidatus Bipolaricaulota bacterium]|nr:hypothetical protein [Candidatus Bipolaricaulota bacterium]
MFAAHDLVWVTAIEGALTEAYMYSSFELFFRAMYKAPELMKRLLDVFTRWGEIISELHAENPSCTVYFFRTMIFVVVRGPSFLLSSWKKRWFRAGTGFTNRRGSPA